MYSDPLVRKDLTARAALQESQDASCSRTGEAAHLVCSQLVLQHRSKHFTWSLQQRQSDQAPAGSLPCAMMSEAVVDIDHELLQRLPLLAGISDDTGRQQKGDNGESSIPAGGAFSRGCFQQGVPLWPHQCSRFSSLPCHVDAAVPFEGI